MRTMVLISPTQLPPGKLMASTILILSHTVINRLSLVHVVMIASTSPLVINKAKKDNPPFKREIHQLLSVIARSVSGTSRTSATALICVLNTHPVCPVWIKFKLMEVSSCFRHYIVSVFRFCDSLN